MRRLHIVFFLIFIPSCLFSQDRKVSVGILPEFAFNYKINGNWSSTFKIESQHTFFHQEDGLNSPISYNYKQTDFQIFANYKIAAAWKAAAGYQYRIVAGENSHRFIQQISVVQKLNAFRLGHRIRFDQSVYKSDVPKFRIRYRLSSDFALSGQLIDPGEFYLKAGIEPILVFHDRSTEIEGRINAALGFLFKDKNKLEGGFDYRTDDYLSEINDHQIWFKISYYFNL